MSAYTLAELKKGLLSIFQLSSPPEANRTSEYKRYCEKARLRGLDPGSFRQFCEAMDEYNREWEVANHEYDSFQM